MFLLRINKQNKYLKNNILHLKQLNFLKNNLKKTFVIINLLKINQNDNNLISIFKNKNFLKTNLKWILKIILSNSNIYFTITNTKNKVKYTFSTGFLNLNNNQKIKKTVILIKMFQLTLSKLKIINKSFLGLHLKNFSKFYTLLIFKSLNQNFIIKHINIFNNEPHNGCRPKKLKRKKQKNKIFD